jgi:SAM-dependent methyltransferase
MRSRYDLESSSDIQRLRDEYAHRDRRLAASDLYTLHNPANLFIFQQRQRAIVALLRQCDLLPLHNKRILEVGCGSGQIMHEFLGYGAGPNNLFGIDILQQHLQMAKQKLPQLPLLCANGQSIPYKSKSFDIVMQFTAFSSVLDYRIKQRIAAEMQRVLSPTGTILWYDFWLNPTNNQTKGIRMQEIKALFPDRIYVHRRITLAPPFARRLVPISWVLSMLLEKLMVLNTHYLVAIQPRTK